MGQPQLLWGGDFWIVLHIITWFLELEWALDNLILELQQIQLDWLCKMGPDLPCPACGIGYVLMISRHPVDKTRIFACYIEYHTLVSFKIAWFADYHMEQQRVIIEQEKNKQMVIAVPPGPGNVPELNNDEIKNLAPVDYYREHYRQLPPTENVFWPMFWRVMRYVARGYHYDDKTKKYSEVVQSQFRRFYTHMPNILPYVWADKRQAAKKYVETTPLIADTPEQLMNWVIEMEQFVHNDKSRMSVGISNTIYMFRLQETQKRFVWLMKDYQTRFDTLKSSLRLDGKTLPQKSAKEWAMMLIPKPQPHFYELEVTSKAIDGFQQNTKGLVPIPPPPSSSTETNAHSPPKSTSNNHHALWIVLGLGVFLFIIMIVIIVFMHRQSTSRYPSFITTSNSESYVTPDLGL